MRFSVAKLLDSGGALRAGALDRDAVTRTVEHGVTAIVAPRGGLLVKEKEK